MTHPRLVAVLVLKNGLIVRSEGFQTHQVLGSPIQTVRRLSNWNVDELVILDISGDDFHDLRRDDHAIRYENNSTIGLLRQISEVCFMPLAFGGRIKSVEGMHAILAAGADKVVINSAAYRNPQLIAEGAYAFGSQCIVVSVDSKLSANGKAEVYIDGGRTPTGCDPAGWAREAESLGAGEIFLNSIDLDGKGGGYDIPLIKSVTSQIGIPVIACGGVGRYEDFPAAIRLGGADAAAAANIFHFYELAYPFAKRECIEAGLPMRDATLSNKWFAREPQYDVDEIKRRIDTRLDKARRRAWPTPPAQRQKVRYCTRCTYPSISAAPMEFDAEGVCMGCKMAEGKTSIGPAEWERRGKRLSEILEKSRARRPESAYDCIVPVSGGKDSYFQVHYMRHVLGAKPLLFTYYGNNFSEPGNRNLYRMKEAFDCDHIIYYPNVTLLKKLNRLGFIIMGDMNWHNHVGITTLVNQLAVEKQIPLVIWGEHGYADLSGQFSMNDFIEYTYRHRFEHFARGYDWNYFVGLEGITSSDMTPYKYPSDQAIFDLDLRGIYLANYVYWEANAHTKLMQKLYGWEAADVPFERTYRQMSNVDDIYENGVHDYLKYIKFGYGRCTDHTCKDIRAGLMNRAQAIDLIRKHDHVRSWDVQHWCDYVGMPTEEFDAIADTFRDPRVWRYEHEEWRKDNLWDRD